MFAHVHIRAAYIYNCLLFVFSFPAPPSTFFLRVWCYKGAAVTYARTGAAATLVPAPGALPQDSAPDIESQLDSIKLHPEIAKDDSTRCAYRALLGFLLEIGVPVTRLSTGTLPSSITSLTGIIFANYEPE